MTFLEQRLELGLNFGATYGPRFNTAIATASNGIEQRRAIWSQPLITVQLGDRRVNQSELDYLLAFHASVKGAFAGFRLRDWSDYKSGLTAIGTGNGTAQTWQLVKRYTVDDVTVTRAITKPIDGTLKVFVGGVQTLTGWTCNYTTGVLSTELTGAIAVTFDFDIPVRFEQDKIDFTYEGGKGTRKLFTLAPLTCVELRLEPAIYPTLDVLPTEIDEVFDLGYDFGTLGGPSFNTAIATNAAEFESRKSYWENAKGYWDVGDRGLLRSELDYFIALFRCARGMAVPFYFKDWQDDQTKLVRFAEDRISFRFDAFRSSDEEVIFNLGGVAIQQTQPFPPPQCQPTTVILTESLNSNNLTFVEQIPVFGAGSGGGREFTPEEIANLQQSMTYHPTGGVDGGRWVESFIEYGGNDDSVQYGVLTYYMTNLFYTPQSAEEIITITFEVAIKNIALSGFNPPGLAVRAVINQSGTLKTGNAVNISIPPTGGPWATYSGSFTLASLELSPITGVPLQFGINRPSFGSLPGNGAGIYSSTIGIDSLSYTVTVDCP